MSSSCNLCVFEENMESYAKIMSAKVDQLNRFQDDVLMSYLKANPRIVENKTKRYFDKFFINNLSTQRFNDENNIEYDSDWTASDVSTHVLDHSKSIKNTTIRNIVSTMKMIKGLEKKMVNEVEVVEGDTVKMVKTYDKGVVIMMKELAQFQKNSYATLADLNFT